MFYMLKFNSFQQIINHVFILHLRAFLDGRHKVNWIILKMLALHFISFDTFFATEDLRIDFY